MPSRRCRADSLSHAGWFAHTRWHPTHPPHTLCALPHKTWPSHKLCFPRGGLTLNCHRWDHTALCEQRIKDVSLPSPIFQPSHVCGARSFPCLRLLLTHGHCAGTQPCLEVSARAFWARTSLTNSLLGPDFRSGFQSLFAPFLEAAVLGSSLVSPAPSRMPGLLPASPAPQLHSPLLLGQPLLGQTPPFGRDVAGMQLRQPGLAGFDLASSAHTHRNP